MSLAPRTVDNVEFTEETDFADLARLALKGWIGGSLRSDCGPADWVFRVYDELAGSPYADMLAAGVAANLASDDPLVREQAEVFFIGRPEAGR
jgi:hypothetical protein